MNSLTQTEIAIVELDELNVDNLPAERQLRRRFFLCKTGKKPKIISLGFNDQVNACHAAQIAEPLYLLIDDTQGPKELWPASDINLGAAEQIVREIGVTGDGYKVFKITAYGKNGQYLSTQPHDKFWLCTADGSSVLSVHFSADSAWRAAGLGFYPVSTDGWVKSLKA